MKPILKSDIDKLIDLSCRYYEVNIEDFYNGKRTRNVTDARRAFFYILKIEPKFEGYKALLKKEDNSYV